MGKIWRLCWMVISACCECSSAVRIALDIDARTSPFLKSTSPSSTTPQVLTAPFTWSHMFLGKLVHQSRVVEVGPRGALFVLYDAEGQTPPPHTSKVAQTTCAPSENALCSTPEGDVLPSALLRSGTAAPTTYNVTASARLTRDPVLRALGRITDACKLEGNGGSRMYHREEAESSEGASTNYTVTACDVLQGTHVLVYEPRTRRLTLRAQTFGPVAYVIVLVSAGIHIGVLAMGPASVSGNWWAFACNGLASIVACAVLYVNGEVHFHSWEDDVLFWANGLCALVSLVRRKDEAYLFALSMMAATLYRTHETPYAPILGYVFGYRTWVQVLQQAQKPASSLWAVWELMLLLTYVSVFCEIAIKPLFIQGGLWRLQLVFHMFITYSLAKYKELSLSSL
jgi:hypothetical protein